MRSSNARAAGAAVGLISMAMTLAVAAATPGRGPLPAVEVSDDGRFLQTEDGEPFFWLADTAWRLFRLDSDELDVYFVNRAEKGFTVIQGPLLLTDKPNYAGEINFDPEQPNEAWFTHIDTIIAKAEAHGLYIAPCLAHGTAESVLTLDTAYSFGHYVGTRYKDAGNIAAFLVATEFNYPEPNVELWAKIAEGLLDGLGDDAPLLTIHPRWFGGYGGQTSSAHLHDADWLGFNMIQSAQYGDCTNDPDHPRYLGVHNWLLVEHDYALSPDKPVLDAEPTFEMVDPNHPSCDAPQPRWDEFGVRRRAYWSVFSGGFGVSYGANGVFQFHQVDDPVYDWAPLDYWDVAMDYPGAEQMGYLRELIESRPFFARIPGQDLLLDDPDGDVPTHVHATRDADGQYAFIYIPQADRDVRIDMTLLMGMSAIAWWYHPVIGTAELIGIFSATDSQSHGFIVFTTPPVGEDWVLVLDDAAQGFPPPGSLWSGQASADLDGDGVVGTSDLLLLIAAWGPCPDPPLACPADLIADGQVDAGDLCVLLAQWGAGAAGA